jgi:hypothetical protein
VERPLFLSDAELNDSLELRRCYREEHDVLAVKEELARELPWMPQPLVFTYYRRVCPGE